MIRQKTPEEELWRRGEFFGKRARLRGEWENYSSYRGLEKRASDIRRHLIRRGASETSIKSARGVIGEGGRRKKDLCLLMVAKAGTAPRDRQNDVVDCEGRRKLLLSGI